MKPPIFIAGTMRSGTTLLCRMVTAHPQIFVKNEIGAAAEVFEGDSSAEDVRRTLDDAMKEVLGEDLDELLQKTGKSRWGIKDPVFTYHLPNLLRVYPDAKILITVRDGRAVALSHMKQRWGPGCNVYSGAKLWLKEVREQKRFRDDHPENCRIVRYETLIEDTEEELKRICEFLDEPYAPEMFAYHEQPAYLAKTKQSKNVFKKPDIRIANKWREALSSRQIDVIEAVAGEELVANGYELAGKPTRISPFRALGYSLHQRIVGELLTQIQWRKLQLARWRRARQGQSSASTSNEPTREGVGQA